MRQLVQGASAWSAKPESIEGSLCFLEKSKNVRSRGLTGELRVQTGGLRVDEF